MNFYVKIGKSSKYTHCVEDGKYFTYSLDGDEPVPVHGHLFVDEDGVDVAVGHINAAIVRDFECAEELDPKYEICELSHMQIDKKHSGNGVGTQALTFLPAILAAEFGIKNLAVTAKPPKKFATLLEKAGYKKLPNGSFCKVFDGE